jgi:hypothetical protein
MENELKKAYDSAVVALQNLTQEAADAEKRLGSTSQIVKNKKAQLETLKNFYQKNKDYIDYLREVSYLMAVNYRALELITMQKETGLPWERVAGLLGFDPERFKKIDSVDAFIRPIYEQLSALESLE